MTDFDAGEIFYSDQGHDNPGTSNSPAHALIQFREFLRQFRINEDFVYRRATSVPLHAASVPAVRMQAPSR